MFPDVPSRDWLGSDAAAAAVVAGPVMGPILDGFNVNFLGAWNSGSKVGGGLGRANLWNSTGGVGWFRASGGPGVGIAIFGTGGAGAGATGIGAGTTGFGAGATGAGAGTT